MSDDHLSLLTLAPGDQQALFEFMVDFQSAGETRFDRDIEEVRTDFPAYLEKKLNQSRGESLPEGIVPATTYYLSGPDRKILGLVSLRHMLNARLSIEGGHVGYAVRPAFRRKGYATLMLALVLEKALQMGIHQALVTCDDDNLASARVIEKNGGILENKTTSPVSNKLIRRYWIEIASAEEK
jgi:predicted acetyltransferase